jgi:hypothetical protein
VAGRRQVSACRDSYGLLGKSVMVRLDVVESETQPLGGNWVFERQTV